MIQRARIFIHCLLPAPRPGLRLFGTGTRQPRIDPVEIVLPVLYQQIAARLVPTIGDAMLGAGIDAARLPRKQPAGRDPAAIGWMAWFCAHHAFEAVAPVRDVAMGMPRHLFAGGHRELADLDVGRFYDHRDLLHLVERLRWFRLRHVPLRAVATIVEGAGE